MSKNFAVITTKQRVDYNGRYYIITPDSAAGRKDRYTVFSMPSHPNGDIEIIGRELPLKFAKELCKRQYRPMKSLYFNVFRQLDVNDKI